MIDFSKKPYYKFGIRRCGCRRSGRRCMVLVPAFLVIAVLFSGCATRVPPGSDQPLANLVQLYRGPLDHLNAVRSGTCPMHPSCSSYALESTEKKGFFVGWMMAFDRLLRCGRDELNYAPKIPVNGKWRYHDPIEANDIWRVKSNTLPPFNSQQELQEDQWVPNQTFTNP